MAMKFPYGISRKDCVRNDRTGVYSITVPVDPKTAMKWLECGAPNRPIRKSRVRQYTEDMRNGNWVYTGVHAIVFNSEGLRTNGEHTLHAIVNSGTTQDLDIKVGVSNAATPYMDRGVIRNSADTAHYQGQTHPKITGPAAKMVIQFNDGKYANAANHRRVPNELITQFLNETPEFNSLGQIIADSFRGSDKVISAVEAATFCWIFSRVSTMEIASEFIHNVLNGAVEKGSPIWKLRNIIIKSKMAGKKITPRDRHAYIVKTWNAHVTGSPLKRLRISSDEPFPKVQSVES